jgi:hypothetical protein
VIRPLIATTLLVLAAATRCDEARPPAPRPPPRPGDAVKLRGVLGEDVDCRLFRADGGTVYSLSVRVPNVVNGERVCIQGTILETSQCLTQPTIEVTAVRHWSACP